MKKLLILSLLAVSCSALAQVAGPTGVAPQTPAGKQGGKVDRKEMAKINEDILAKLNLTDEQKAKIKAHEEESKAKLKDLRKGAKGAGQSDETKEKIKALRKENQTFMKTVLTKEQMREMVKLRREAVKTLREKKDPAKP